MSAEVREFGTLADGRSTQLFVLTNGNGTEAVFTDLGAAWVSMKVQDREGEPGDVLLGYDDPETYNQNPTAMGECVGRSANRIGNGKFTLEGVEYQLARNNHGKNNLHSGPELWCSRLFAAETEQTKLGSRVSFRLNSPDGDQGFPGALAFSVSYTLTEDDSVIIEYSGISDRTTIINPTNHAYFNLRGHDAGDILEQEVWINADYFTPVDAWSLPTGELRPVDGTPMDFTMQKPIGQDIDADDEQLRFGNGYDHNFVLNNQDGKLRLVAKAKDRESGRKLKIYTDLPGLQFYTGNALRAEQAEGKGGAVYDRRAGYCFETQFYPDAVNHAEWPQPVFRAGEEYHHFTIYKFVTRLDEEEEETD